MHPDDFCTRWERDYRNSCGIRPRKLRNYLSEREGILDQRTLGEGHRGSTNVFGVVLSSGEKPSESKYEIFL